MNHLDLINVNKSINNKKIKLTITVKAPGFCKTVKNLRVQGLSKTDKDSYLVCIGTARIPLLKKTMTNVKVQDDD
jgi:hypothetical protein